MKLSEIAESIGGLTLIGVGLSLGYESRFLALLGVSTSTVPIQPEDYTRSVSVWLPSLVVSGIIFAFFEGSTTAIEGGRTESEILNSSRNPKALKFFRDSPHYFMAFVFGILGVLSIFDITPKGLQPSMLWFIFWVTTGGMVFSSEGVLRKFGPKLVRYIYISGACILFTFSSAESSVGRLMAAPLLDTIVLTDGTSIKCKILRCYSSQVLFRDDNSKSFTVISNASIQSIKHHGG